MFTLNCGAEPSHNGPKIRFTTVNVFLRIVLVLETAVRYNNSNRFPFRRWVHPTCFRLRTGMNRWLVVALLLYAGWYTSLVARADDPELMKALALQRVMEKIIQEAEPAIACILVSRSEEYARVHQGPDKDQPGKLGSFDPSLLPEDKTVDLVQQKQKKRETQRRLD